MPITESSVSLARSRLVLHDGAAVVAPAAADATTSTEVAPPVDLPRFLRHAHFNYMAPYCVRVRNIQQELPHRVDDRPRRKPNQSRPSTAPAEVIPVVPVTESGSGAELEVNVVEVGAVYDAAGQLVELRFTHQHVPGMLLKIVALCAPFHPYLERFAAHHCALELGALRELERLAASAHLVDVCLDGSRVPEARHHELLERAGLRHLSLARCELGDKGARDLAACLAHPRPASRSLRSISLASNGIADEGARALGEALRGNRMLQYLNLAGNRIGDEGAAHIFHSLGEFPLTYDEVMASRRARLVLERRRLSAFERHATRLAAVSRPAEESRGAGPGRRRGPGVRAAPTAVIRPPPVAGAALTARAAALARAEVAARSDWREPFSAEATVERDGHVFSLGNTELCALNLSYNDVGLPGVAVLVGALRAQAARGAGGLRRALLAGNPLPRAADELADLDDLLQRALLLRLADAPKKSDRMKKRSTVLH